jgi:hypothetical protein
MLQRGQRPGRESLDLRILALRSLLLEQLHGLFVRVDAVFACIVLVEVPVLQRAQDLELRPLPDRWIARDFDTLRRGERLQFIAGPRVVAHHLLGKRLDLRVRRVRLGELACLDLGQAALGRLLQKGGVRVGQRGRR